MIKIHLIREMSVHGNLRHNIKANCVKKSIIIPHIVRRLRKFNTFCFKLYHCYIKIEKNVDSLNYMNY